jgi:hypothetical protein
MQIDNFLDFEKPIKDLIDEIENAKHRQENQDRYGRSYFPA